MATAKKNIKKSNALINAAYTLSLAEQRLILLAIAQADGAVEAIEDELSVHARDYAKHFSVEMPAAYDALRAAAAALFERRFRYQRRTSTGKMETVISRWVQHVVYGADEGLVRMRFVTDLVPLLTDLRERFTQYGLEKIAGLTSAYAVRLYELLIAWRSTKTTPVIEITDLRRRLGVEEHEYPRLEALKRRVIDFALAQINAHTDITARYEQVKRGRRIEGIKFTFTTKKAAAGASKEEKPKIIQTISKREAEERGRPGEEWDQLILRLFLQGIKIEGIDYRRFQLAGFKR